MTRTRSRSGLLATAVVTVAALGLTVAPTASAAPAAPAGARLAPTHPGTPRGFALPHRAGAAAGSPQNTTETRVCDGCTPPLLNGGGPVMGTATTPGENTQYSIYWDPNSGMSATFKNTIDQYLTDMAADSGKATNVYSVLNQYSGISYVSHFGGRLPAPDPLPTTSGCPVDPGYTVCLSDAQLQAEIANVIQAQGLTTKADLAHQFILFTAPGVESCDSPGSCSNNKFCGYHSNYDIGGYKAIYSNMPYASLQGCASGQQPNGDPIADGEIDTLSHELAESITDPVSQAPTWGDSTGHEIGDECSNIYGAPIGSADSTNPDTTKFNQVINGHNYYTQEEFSNQAFAANGAGCVQAGDVTQGTTGNRVTVVPSPARIPSDGTSTSTVNATVMQPTGTAAVNGDEVDFTTYSTTGNCGIVNPTKVMTNSSGVATTTYTASTANDELCTVIASEVATGQAGQGAIVQGGEIFHALAPFRLADTRGGCSTCAVNGPALSPDATISVPVRGQDTVPADATAAVLNITTTNGTAGSFFTAYGNAPRPTASNVNFVAGQTVANLATVPLDASGHVNVYNLAGTADLIVDLEGYMEPVAGPLGLFHAASPARITDTRAGSGFPNAGATPGTNGVVQVHVLGAGPVPSGGVSAVALNVTAVTPTNSGFLTVYPNDATTRPTASNINFVAGEVVPNRVIVKVPTDGIVDVYNLAGSTDVVVDVVGWFNDGAGTGGALFTPLPPTRVADTRAGSGQRLAGQTVGPAAPLLVPVSAPLGLPTDAAAVAGNVTVVNTTAASYLTVYPPTASRPTASDLNWVAGQVVPNQVIAAIGGGGLEVYNNSGSTDVIVDISGFWS